MNDFEIINKLRDIYTELSRKFNFHCPCNLDIVISNRLRSSNGIISISRYCITHEIMKVKITMSKALLTEFGWTRFESTFRHEIAHLADAILNGNRGHGHSFKRLCQQFGGTMNRAMAGYRYADCADADFIKPIVKWVYTCPGCGKEKKMGKRMAKRKRGNPNFRCSRECYTSLDQWTEVRIA